MFFISVARGFFVGKFRFNSTPGWSNYCYTTIESTATVSVISYSLFTGRQPAARPLSRTHGEGCTGSYKDSDARQRHLQVIELKSSRFSRTVLSSRLECLVSTVSPAALYTSHASNQFQIDMICAIISARDVLVGLWGALIASTAIAACLSDGNSQRIFSTQKRHIARRGKHISA